MIHFALAAALIAYLPGALIYRLPILDRARRAGLSAEERTFWHVMLSAIWSVLLVVGLACAGRYQFERLLIANTILCGVLIVAARASLRYRGTAQRATWAMLLPLVLVALGVWRFFPTSEYIIGGKDPGTYMNEGIQIAQRGTVIYADPDIAALPPAARDLFIPDRHDDAYYSNRFMGFFVRAPQGPVTGQFPHVFPASIAIGYGLAGLTGARDAVAVWAVLGLLAVYVAGMRLVGRPAAFAGVTLLALHVITVWYARYPNAEVTLQACLFALLLALARALVDGDAFFAPVAGALIVVLLFLKIDVLLIGAALAAAMVVMYAAGLKPGATYEAGLKPGPTYTGVIAPLALAAVPAWWYWSGPMLPYWWPEWRLRLEQVTFGDVAVGVGGALAALALAELLRRRYSAAVQRAVPIGLAAVVTIAATYGYFFRYAAGKLAAHDAFAFRTVTDFFLMPWGAAAAILGLVLVARRAFWRDPVLLLVVAGLSLFFFYKIRIVPEHLWMERRLVGVVLPGALLFAAAAAIGPEWTRITLRGALRSTAGLIFVGILGWQYAAAAAPVMPHVEYAGIIQYTEQLAAKIGDDDLVIVESRNAGTDTHVFAVPLAYIYARHVLVLDSPRPDKAVLHVFLDDARRRYRRVLFLGGGGTDLLSRRIGATPLSDGRVKVPEYATTPWDTYPAGIRRKDFDYSLYEIQLDAPSRSRVAIDIGDRDDLNVIRFNAKETSDGRSIRWTMARSQVAVVGLTGSERDLTLVMHDGGRPSGAAPARVRVSFNGADVGTVDVTPGFKEYHFTLPADLVSRAASADDPAQILLESTVWVPREFNGGNDDRQLGVMLDRVEIGPPSQAAGVMR